MQHLIGRTMTSETVLALFLLIIVAMILGIFELPDIRRLKIGRPPLPYSEHKCHEIECRSSEIGIIRDDTEIYGRNQITVFEKTLLGANHHSVLLWRTAKVGFGALFRRVGGPQGRVSGEVQEWPAGLASLSRQIASSVVLRPHKWPPHLLHQTYLV